MIKVLVVEDDKLARKGLIHAMPWTACDMEVVGEAGSGQAALDFLGSHDVDLMLTDLAMPGLSGIELMKAARLRHPRVLCAVLTFHQELEYAQEAIRLGAIDYVAKVQLEKEKFDDVLARIRSRFLEERTKMDAFRPDAGIPAVFTADMTYALLSVEEGADWGWMALAIMDPRLRPVEIGNGVWLWGPSSGPDPQTVTAMRKEIAGRDGWMLIQLHGLTGEHVDRVNSVLRKYHQSRFFYDFSRQEPEARRTLAELDKPAPSSEEPPATADRVQWLGFEWVYDDALYEDLARRLRAGMPAVSRLLRLFVEVESEWNRVYASLTGFHAAVPETFPSWQASERWLADMRRSALAGIRKASHGADVVSSVMKAVWIVDRELGSQLFAVDVARRVNMSRGHFCECFKDIVGKPFNDHLRNARLEKAKLLLLRTDTPIYHVAEKVGYTDEKYFSRVFKEGTGTLPSEFRQHAREGRRLS